MVSVAPASSTVVEGGTAAFTVTLSGAASSATVLGWSTDGVTATSGTDFTAVTSGALTIDAGDTTGTLSVATSQDDFAESTETFTVTITGTTLPSGVTLGTATATGTITDDDTRGVVVTPTNVQFLEESSDTYTVVLLSAPNDLVTVALTLTGDTSVTTDVPALEFDESNWDTPQTVTVYGMADADGDNDKATIDHTVSGGDYEAETAASVTVEVTDPHTVSSAVTLELDPAEVAESASAETVTVTASLNEAPRTEDTVVTVSVAGATATVATDFEAVEAFDLTITAGETSGTADFALTPVNDAVDEEDETVEVSGTTTAEELTVTPATVTIRDDDTRDVAVEPETLTFAEGETGEYTVVLTSQPTANVTVRLTVDGDDDVAADVTALTFTAANWSQEQTVTVSGAADQDAENDEATIDHDVKGGDYEAQAVTAASVTVTVNDGDQASSTVTLDLNPDEVAESSSGETVTVTARLDGAVLAEATVVRVSVAGETAEAGADFAAVEAFDVKIEVGEKSGTADFELAPVDDAIDEADETLRVTGTTETEGLTVDDESAVLTIEDDDERGVTVSPENLTLVAGESGEYTVELTSQPTVDVTLTLAVEGDGDVTVDQSSLTFPADDWDVPQTVTVIADADTDADADAETIITHTVTSPGDYADETAASVTVTIVQAGVAAVTISPQELEIPEGESQPYMVGLTMEPTGPVTVSVHGMTDDVRVEEPELRFMPEDWSTAQAVEVFAEADEDTEAEDPVMLTHEVSGGGYDDVQAKSVMVQVLEDAGPAAPGVRISPTALTIKEGTSKRYTVQLKKKPSDSVTVTVAGMEGDVDVDESELTFTPENWGQPQFVEVEVAEDDDTETDDPVTLRHTLNGGGYDDAQAESVIVTCVEDDRVELTVALAAHPVEVEEAAGATPVTVTATLTDVRAGATRVTLRMRNGTATAADYGATSGSLTIRAGRRGGGDADADAGERS